MRTLIRGARSAAAVALACVIGTAGASAAYPEKPVTIVIGYSAGGASDLVTRLMQPELAKALGTEVIVQNLTGAAGTVGAAEAAAARPDGYTVLNSPIGAITLQPHLRELPYDMDDFTPVCRLTNAPVGLMSTKESEIKTIDDIVSASQERANSVTYASTGAGGIPHVSMIALSEQADIQMRHVPFRGSAEVMQALMGGTVDIFGDQLNLIPRYDLHPIAIFSEERLPEFPDTPTVKEEGYDLVFSIWNAFFVPAGTPDEIVATLADACEAALTSDAVVEGMQEMQMPIAFLPPDEAAEFVREEYEKNGELLAGAGLKVD